MIAEQGTPDPPQPAQEPPALERKDWLGAGGSVLAIALSVLGMNKEPARAHADARPAADPQPGGRCRT